MFRSKLVYRVKGRDIIKVTLDNGKTQPFYKSTGRNSRMEGVWLPFNGILTAMGRVVWFDKRGYRVPEDKEATIDRYGNELLKEISNKLAQINIPEGTEEEDINEITEINRWLGYLK